MRTLKYIVTSVLLALCAIVSRAQGGEDNEAMLSLRAGHNVSFGGFAAASVEVRNTPGEHFKINSGIQYSSIGRAAVEARPAYFKDFTWGRLAAEALLAYTNLSSVNNFAAGAGLNVRGKYLEATLGYYYRIYGGRGGRIQEPFNIYYDFRAHLLPSIEKWDVQLAITNCETFELERHYQPSFLAECRYYPGTKLGVALSLGCKPAGMFNMSADYYQSFLKIGVCYRW